MKDFLNKNAEALLCEFWDFSEKTEKLLEQLGIKVSLPINIREVARKLGFDISYNVFSDEENPVFATSTPKTINLRLHLTHKEERWAIAKAVSYFLINSGSQEIIHTCNPFFVSCNIDEFYLDAFAILLLLPISLFKKEVSKNIGKSDFLQRLSDQTQIPVFQLSIGYQLIKQMLCFQRYKAFEECDFDVTKVPVEQYEEIFI